MGASEYKRVGKGKTAEVAFRNLGGGTDMGSYHGNIQCKPSCVEFTRPKGMRRATVIQLIRDLGRIGFDDDGNPKTDKVQAKYPKLRIAAMSEVYEDKWGPSLAIELSKGEYLFAGFASS